MTTPKIQPSKPVPFDWLTLLQFGCSGLMVAGGLTLILGLALNTLLAPWLGTIGQEPLFVLTTFLGTLAACLALAPSAWHALRRILNLPAQGFRAFGSRFGYAILALPLALVASHWALQAGLEWLVALLYLVPAVLVVVWLAWLALHGLQLGSAQRVWGALTSGLVGVPAIAFILEILAGIALLIVLAIYVQLSPQLSQALQALMDAPVSLVEEDLSLIAPFFNDPVILLAAFFALSVMVPIIEELFKPLAAYLLLRRPLSRADGFALGALGGAGFALAENLFLSAPADTLVLAAAARGGASAMHILTAGLGGYAAVRFKQQRKYGGLLAVFGLIIFIHALWNGLVLLSAAGAISEIIPGGLVPVEFAAVASVLLAVLGISCAYFIWRINRKLRSDPNA
ncbi:MAG: PrsW family intramembrane metalloprotease [Anaerolineales bacterium]|nr:PrsW family intramembrane metalloprotease [Anaerolineales bacterium]